MKFKKALLTTLLSGLTLLPLTKGLAQDKTPKSPWSFALGYTKTDYFFRGIRQHPKNSYANQFSADIGYKFINLNLWANENINLKSGARELYEFDINISAKKETKLLDATAGYVQFYYPDSEDPMLQEVYLELEGKLPLSPTIMVTRDLDSKLDYAHLKTSQDIRLSKGFITSDIENALRDFKGGIFLTPEMLWAWNKEYSDFNHAEFALKVEGRAPCFKLFTEARRIQPFEKGIKPATFYSIGGEIKF